MNKKIENYKSVYNYCHNANAKCRIKCSVDKTSTIIRVTCELQRSNRSTDAYKILGISTILDGDKKQNWVAVTIDNTKFQTESVKDYWIEFDESTAYICALSNETNLKFSFDIWNACSSTNNILPFMGKKIEIRFLTNEDENDGLITFVITEDMGIRSIKGNYRMAYPSQSSQGSRILNIYYPIYSKSYTARIRTGWIIDDIMLPWSISLKSCFLLSILFLFGYLPLGKTNNIGDIIIPFVTAYISFSYYCYSVLNFKSQNSPYNTGNNFHLIYLIIHIVAVSILYISWLMFSYDIVFGNQLFIKYKKMANIILKTTPAFVLLLGIIGILGLVLYSIGFWDDYRCDNMYCNHRFIKRTNVKECRYTGRVFCRKCQKDICQNCLYYWDLIDEDRISIKNPSLKFIPCLYNNSTIKSIIKSNSYLFSGFFGGDPYPVTLEHVAKREDTQKQIKFIEEIINIYCEKKRKARIMDAGCGYGRHSIPLFEKGYNVTAVDLLLSNCEYTRNRNSDIPIINQRFSDIRSDLPYDIIYSIYTSIGYDEDEDKRTFKKFHELLVDQGILCIDVDNQKQKPLTIHYEPTFSGIGLGIKLLIKSRVHYFVVSFQKRRVKIHTLSYKHYKEHELINIISQYGFEIVHRYGDFDFRDYNDTSKRCILVFKKN